MSTEIWDEVDRQSAAASQQVHLRGEMGAHRNDPQTNDEPSTGYGCIRGKCSCHRNREVYLGLLYPPTPSRIVWSIYILLPSLFV